MSGKPFTVGKLSDGRIVRILKYNVPVAFDTTRKDWVFVSYPVERSAYGVGSNKTELFWTTAPRVVWMLNM